MHLCACVEFFVILIHVLHGQQSIVWLQRERNMSWKTSHSQQAIISITQHVVFLQCQMDSFRLVRYEMSSGGTPGWGCANLLLQQRHNAAPGMILVSEPAAGTARGCRLCSLHVSMAATRRQQQCLYKHTPHLRPLHICLEFAILPLHVWLPLHCHVSCIWNLGEMFCVV